MQHVCRIQGAAPSQLSELSHGQTLIFHTVQASILYITAENLKFKIHF